MADEIPDENLPSLAEDPLIEQLGLRKARALGGFERLNVGAREGEPQFGPPPLAEIEAKIDTLATRLISAGLLELRDFIVEYMMRECEALEGSLKGAQEFKRRQSGLILPPSANGNGQ